MRLAVLSGKGGAGKTFLAVNLAAAAKDATYVDCDVEEPNGRLFLKPEDVRTDPVYTMLPDFDEEMCIGCRKCVNFCRFNALVFVNGMPMLCPGVCHSCGGCGIVCPAGAILEKRKQMGVVEYGMHKTVDVITGVLTPGEASGIRVIKDALGKAMGRHPLTVIDCPPGSACSVMDTVSRADYCIITAEPTAFGFHNFLMVHELVRLLKKPFGVVINKMSEPYAPLEDFLRENEIPVLQRIPYDEKIAKICAEGRILCEEDKEAESMFLDILQKAGGAVS